MGVRGQVVELMGVASCWPIVGKSNPRSSTTVVRSKVIARVFAPRCTGFFSSPELLNQICQTSCTRTCPPASILWFLVCGCLVWQPRDALARQNYFLVVDLDPRRYAPFTPLPVPPAPPYTNIPPSVEQRRQSALTGISHGCLYISFYLSPRNFHQVGWTAGSSTEVHSLPVRCLKNGGHTQKLLQVQ